MPAANDTMSGVKDVELTKEGVEKAWKEELNGQDAQALVARIVEAQNGTAELMSTTVESQRGKQAAVSYANEHPENFVTTMAAQGEKGVACVAAVMPEMSKEASKEAAETALKLASKAYRDGDRTRGVVVLRIVVKQVGLDRDYDVARVLGIAGLFADRRLGQGAVAQIAVLAAKAIAKNAAVATRAFEELVDDLLLADTADGVVTAFTLVSVLFSVDQSVGQQVFKLEALQQRKFSASHFRSEDVVAAALDALSAACAAKDSRALVASNFAQYARDAFENAPADKPLVRVLAASVLVKSLAGASMQGKSKEEDEAARSAIAEFSAVFETIVADYKVGSDQKDSNTAERCITVALEGLAYTALLPEVQRRLDLANVASFLTITKKTPAPWTYCALTILSVATRYRPKLSAEQQKMSELKTYAGRGVLDAGAAGFDPDDIVTARCAKVLAANVVAAISQRCHTYTPASLSAAAVLLRNLVVEQKHRARFVQQGGLPAATFMALSTDRLSERDRSIAASALAKALISTNPAVAFSPKFSPLSVIAPLARQLLPDGDSAGDLPLLDTFEALMALTNLASLGDSVCPRIVADTWSRVELALTASNALVQRAAVELICNLAPSPSAAQKLLDANSVPARSNLELIAALTDAEDRPTRLAAAGAFAILSEWAVAPAVIGTNETILGRMARVLAQNDTDLVLRAAVAVSNLIAGSQDDPSIFARVRSAVESSGALSALRVVATNSSDDETRSAVSQALQLV